MSCLQGSAGTHLGICAFHPCNLEFCGSSSPSTQREEASPEDKVIIPLYSGSWPPVPDWPEGKKVIIIITILVKAIDPDHHEEARLQPHNGAREVHAWCSAGSLCISCYSHA